MIKIIVTSFIPCGKVGFPENIPSWVFGSWIISSNNKIQEKTTKMPTTKNKVVSSQTELISRYGFPPLRGNIWRERII
jgi:hypothetical protein